MIKLGMVETIFKRKSELLRYKKNSQLLSMYACKMYLFTYDIMLNSV